MFKFNNTRRKIGVIVSTIILIAIVLLSAVYVKYAIYGTIFCILFLFYISYKMHLF